MRLIDSETAALIDNQTMKDYYINPLILMEHAGTEAYQTIIQKYNPTPGKTKFSIIIGKGNNGGDGLVLARLLHNNGYYVRIFSLYEPVEFAPDAKVNWDIIEAMDIDRQFIFEHTDFMMLKIALMASHYVVDAIFGSGFKGETVDVVAGAIDIINKTNRPIISLDIPSGVNADTGNGCEQSVQADLTICFGLPKYGNVLGQGHEYCGELVVKDISIPSTFTKVDEASDVLLDKKWVLEHIRVRKKETHKGNYGHILVAGGSNNMSGCIVLSSLGAIKSGAGLVTALVPKSLQPLIRVALPEVMTYPLKENGEKSLDSMAAEEILQQTGNKILVFGMGVSRHEHSGAIVKKIINNVNCPMVLDADALTFLGEIKPPRKSKHPLILTPHPGEMARMLNTSIREIQEYRVEAAKKAAEDWHAIVVLKGNNTIIANPDGRIFVNPTGNPGMATGGTGDVLAGIIGSFLGQGYEPMEAAALGVYFHGLAGDYAAKDKGEAGLTASDIPEYLPQVLRDYDIEKRGL